MTAQVAVILVSIPVLYVALKGCIETMLDAVCGPEEFNDQT